MPTFIVKKVAARHLAEMPSPGRVKTAGEVRFIKDRSGDEGQWGWGAPGPSNREMEDGFEFHPKYLKPLALTMRSALMALGHVASAHERFVKIKSRNISPDGALGGRGYIQKIPDMRRQLMNCVEALSAFTDTIYDEINAPHWDISTPGHGLRERDDVKEILTDVEEIKDDPEAWAEEEEEEMDEGKVSKTASSHVAVNIDLPPVREPIPEDYYLKAEKKIMRDHSLEAHGLEDKILMLAWDSGYAYGLKQDDFYRKDFILQRFLAIHHNLDAKAIREFNDGLVAGKKARKELGSQND